MTTQPTDDVIWIRTVDRAQWDAMTPAERDERLEAFARFHQDNIAPAHAVVFDPAESPMTT